MFDYLVCVWKLEFLGHSFLQKIALYQMRFYQIRRCYFYWLIARSSALTILMLKPMHNFLVYLLVCNTHSYLWIFWTILWSFEITELHPLSDTLYSWSIGTVRGGWVHRFRLFQEQIQVCIDKVITFSIFLYF